MNFSVVLQCGWGERLLRWSVPVSGVGMTPLREAENGAAKVVGVPREKGMAAGGWCASGGVLII